MDISKELAAQSSGYVDCLTPAEGCSKQLCNDNNCLPTGTASCLRKPDPPE